MAQPTFSVAIKTLEDILGTKLVDRDNKNVVITPLGIEVAKRARKILAGAEELSNITFSQQQPLTGQLRLGIIPTIAPFTLPRLLPKILKEYPQLDLYIKEDLTLNVYQDMMRGELDLILIALPYQLENVDEISLFRDHFLFACRRNTRLLNQLRYSERRLPPASILLLVDGHCLRKHALSVCNIKDTTKISSYTTSSLYTLVQMVNHDLGVTFIPELAAQSDLLSNSDIVLSKMPSTAYREIGFAWRSNSFREREFRIFSDLFRSLSPNGLNPDIT